MAVVSRAVKNAAAMMRAGEWGSGSIIPPNSQSPSILSPGGAGEAAALGISTYLSCQKALSEDMKLLGFNAYEGDRNGARQPIKNQPRIVVEPFGPDMDVHEGISQITTSYGMRGAAYGFVVATDPRTNLPDQLLIVHPDAVTPRWVNGRKRFKIGHDEYGTDQVIQINSGLMIPGSAAGVDILTAQRINFELAQKVGKYAEGFFGGGGSPTGVISVPGEGDRKKAREVRDVWEASHGGIANAHRPAVMFGGATWQQMSVTPENAQFLETRRFLREEICGLFSVPLQRIQAITDNASQGGGKGLDAIDAGYVKHGLLPIAVAIESAWDRMIPGDQSTWSMFDFDVFLRASAEIRATVAQQHRVGGIRTIDEIRAAEGWAPLPNGQGADPFTPLNSNTSPTGGADNAPKPGNEGGN